MRAVVTAEFICSGRRVVTNWFQTVGVARRVIPALKEEGRKVACR